ncbi:SPOR domain-containing protein [Stutzerimonas urumqiensis]|uniref:SPOR domain-containing protein n=1 Tax=Stutzerimonas urumqiensis TaxID=638269 RepID=UPI003BAB1EF0
MALAVIFLPMLFNREDELRHVRVDAPPMPEMPAAPQIELEPVAVPEPTPDASPTPPTETPVETLAAAPDSATVPSQPEARSDTEEPAAVPVVPSKPIEPMPAEPRPVERSDPGLDANDLPESWSVQLASLSNRASADALQAKLRKQGYNAYVRSVDGMNRVFVGPLIERDQASQLRDQLHRQQKLDGFVVKFKPESQ